MKKIYFTKKFFIIHSVSGFRKIRNICLALKAGHKLLDSIRLSGYCIMGTSKSSLPPTGSICFSSFVTKILDRGILCLRKLCFD